MMQLSSSFPRYLACSSYRQGATDWLVLKSRAPREPWCRNRDRKKPQLKRPMYWEEKGYVCRHHTINEFRRCNEPHQKIKKSRHITPIFYWDIIQKSERLIGNAIEKIWASKLVIQPWHGSPCTFIKRTKNDTQASIDTVPKNKKGTRVWYHLYLVPCSPFNMVAPISVS